MSIHAYVQRPVIVAVYVARQKSCWPVREVGAHGKTYKDAIRPRRDISAPYRAQDKPNPNDGDWHNEVARDLPTATAI